MVLSLCCWYQFECIEDISIRPRMSMDLSLSPSMSTEVVTIKGSVSVSYDRDENNGIVMSVTVPHNAHAIIEMEPVLVGGTCVMLSENGVEMWNEAEQSSVHLLNAVNGIEYLERDEETGVMSMRVGGGSYQFVAQWK